MSHVGFAVELAVLTVEHRNGKKQILQMTAN